MLVWSQPGQRCSDLSGKSEGEAGSRNAQGQGGQLPQEAGPGKGVNGRTTAKHGLGSCLPALSSLTVLTGWGEGVPGSVGAAPASRNLHLKVKEGCVDCVVFSPGLPY